MTSSSHPIEVDLDRILPLLTREIYTSPFAFLRENVQNAFDAIRLQRFRDKMNGVSRDHEISIQLADNRLSISDTGIGMSQSDLANFFWSIGKSGKHTSEAKSAGVVGTFGIGGMANFGVCSKLEVLTRTHTTEQSVLSFAERAKLSAKQDCVFYEIGPLDAPVGTTVTGTLLEPISSDQVIKYLEPIVRFIDVPVVINGQLLSQKPFPSLEKSDATSYSIEHGQIKATVWIRALQTGQAEVEVTSLSWQEVPTQAHAVFGTQMGVITAYQHGFMLANVPMNTVFGLGGAIDGVALRPTAGREAVTDESRSLVQNLVGAVEHALATHIASSTGLAERFSAFFKYLSQHGHWQMAGSATVRTYGATARVRLDSLKNDGPGKVYFAREGHDVSIMQAYLEQQKTVVLLSSDNYRQRVESQYLQSFCSAILLEDRVTCLKVLKELSWPEEALKFQLHDRLRKQFLVENLHIKAGKLSHNAMLWTPPTREASSERALYIDFAHPQIQRLVGLRNSLSFDAVFNIFIRDSVLPHLETSFPELRKRDFDALLKKLHSSVEYFEIDPEDVGRLQQLAATTNMPPEIVAIAFGGRRPGSPRATSLVASDVVSVVNEVNQVVEQAPGKAPNEVRRELEIRLLETEFKAKILDAREADPQLGLAPYYLALTSDAHVLYRRIFLERKPSTDFSWGGHRAGYLFYSEGTAVVYYDIQFGDMIEQTEKRDRTGTTTLTHTPLVLKNQVFLPIPSAFESLLVPKDKTVKFTINHQILGVETANEMWM